MNKTTSISKKKEEPDGKAIEFELNWPQMQVHIIQAAITYLLWGRGAGKTVGGIAPWMVRVAEAMPGHLSGIFGQTFTHLDNNIMPKIFLGLANLGFVKDVDYVAGKKPPEDWDKCLYPIKDYKRTITWPNGTTWQQVSLHERGSANAFDFQSGIFDECKYMDPAQLEDEVFPTFRGFDNLWGDFPEYLSKIFCSDKLMDYPLIKWLLDKRKKVDHDKIRLVVELQGKVNELESFLADPDTTATDRVKLKRAIRKLSKRLRSLRKGLVYVSEASARENIKNLGMAWFKDKRSEMSKYEFSIAIDNDDPLQAKQGFYPDLGDKNMYNEPFAGFDCVSTLPLIVSLDYQASIAPMCVSQISQLPGNNYKSLNYINEFYTLAPQNLEACVDLFCEHYKGHACKRVHYVYDQTAIGRRATAKPVFEIVIARIRKNGWKVVKVYTADTPEHYDKYLNINAWFREVGKWLPILINKTRCVKTLISMQAAGTKVSDGKTKKDKEYENVNKYPSVDQSETTHFSDTFDMGAWAVNKLKVIRMGGGGGSKVACR